MPTSSEPHAAIRALQRFVPSVNAHVDAVTSLGGEFGRANAALEVL